MKPDLQRIAKDLGIYPGKHVWPKSEPMLARFAARMMEEAAKACDKRAKQPASIKPENEAAECAKAIRAVATEVFQ